MNDPAIPRVPLSLPTADLAALWHLRELTSEAAALRAQSAALRGQSSVLRAATRDLATAIQRAAAGRLSQPNGYDNDAGYQT